MAPLVTNCTIYIESMTWIIVGDKESVENCKCQMITLIQFLEMRLKASGITTITKTMFLTKYADLILESKLYERSHLETLKVDFDEKYEYIKVKGEKLAVESVMQELQSFLQAAKGSVYKGSPLILRLLNNTKVKANLKKLLRNRGLVSAWRIVEDICIVYGTSLEDVRSVKKIFIRRLVSETIKLSDGQNELMYSEKGKQEIAYMTNRYDGFLEIEISGHFMEIACTFEIQTEVRNILREFLNRHEVIKTIHEVDNGLFKLLQHYHDDKLAIMQQRCMKIMLVEVSPFEENSKCGFLLTGRREFCIEAARELEKVLATVTGFELTIKRVEFISFLRSEKGRGQIATFESENQCIVQFPNGSPISQNKVCVCQYDNKELIVLNDDISAVTKGLAYIPFQTSDKQTMSPADGKYLSK